MSPTGPRPDGVPGWLRPLVAVAATATTEQLFPIRAPASGARESAVLVLFGEGEHGPDLLLIERSAALRSHAGQPAFPGGGAEPGDDGPAGTALREAAEEVGLDPGSVTVLSVLPGLFLPPSNYLVHPVLAWSAEPGPLRVADPVEVASVTRVPVAELVDPAARVMVSHPSGLVGPAFEVRDMLVWGFTAALLDRLLDLGGLALPWDRTRVRSLPAEALRLAARTRPPQDAADEPDPPDRAVRD